MTNTFDTQYKELLQQVINAGELNESRGLRYLQVFGQQLFVDLRLGFPLSTLRRLPWKALLDETRFDLSGSSKLEDMGRAAPWWSYLADANGDIDYTYGNSWRYRWGDQLSWVIEQLQCSPSSRRIVMQTYDPQKRGTVKCPPCHTELIFSTSNAGGSNRWLDLMVTARSNDLSFAPLDYARYALIQHLIAADGSRQGVAKLHPRFLSIPSANNHVYTCNIEHTRELLRREPRPLPTLKLTPFASALNFQVSDVTLEGYDPHPSLPPEFAK